MPNIVLLPRTEPSSFNSHEQAPRKLDAAYGTCGYCIELDHGVGSCHRYPLGFAPRTVAARATSVVLAAGNNAFLVPQAYGGIPGNIDCGQDGR
jgi:hypothetical protein